MMVALRIRTTGLGWRRYVEGYCGPIPPSWAVSRAAAVAEGAAGGTGVGPPAAVVRAPPDAQPATRAVPPKATATDRCRLRDSPISRGLILACGPTETRARLSRAPAGA